LHGTGTEILYIYDPAGNENKGQGRVSYQTVTGTWKEILINFGTRNVQGKIYRVDGWTPRSGKPTTLQVLPATFRNYSSCG
jgi:hypothetical protein